ncbi:uncharacterized protein [Physcomitrium patens]|uniref:LHC-related protein n=1 Tax=Physcomitrium patens TaxID=3218 RepID=A9SHE3_PHYPA|nr:light-harvesting complex-like protein 3 isotype 1, chloroplastic [Physcomitrium patens]PNR40840.1 hypothetical protein PHYPA_018243 [Physcomitrium patens]|eukprot:XP_024395563.1 light-harvesting complex-like protein 3 isotype 1, chloroplastic [Physcomitrella patens]
MAVMATISGPLAGAIPVVNRGALSVRPQVGNCKQVSVCSWRGQSRLSGFDNGESDGRVRFVVRASEETGGNGVDSQMPTNAITETEASEGAGSLATEKTTPLPLQNEDAASKESDTLVGGTPTSSTGSKTEETNDSPTEVREPSASQNGDATSKESETLVGGTPTSPIDSKSEETRDPPAAVREPPPLQKGGTLDGDEAAGKAPAAATLGKNATPASNGSGKFEDPRWSAGTWDITKFTRNGKIDWDAVIDAEVVRRKWLEENPETSNNAEPVVFDTATVPWWAWVKRFHLPEAELLNGRAAMVGYAAGYLVDSATGYGLVDQQSSFLGKLLIFFTILGVLLIRKDSDVANIRTIVKESTFYDKQWQATWKDDDDNINNNNEKTP